MPEQFALWPGASSSPPSSAPAPALPASRRLIDNWRLLRLPRATRPEELHIEPQGLGQGKVGWRVVCCFLNPPEIWFTLVASFPGSTGGIYVEGLDAIQADDVDRVEHTILAGLRGEAHCWGTPVWSRDQDLVARWLKDRNDQREADRRRAWGRK